MPSDKKNADSVKQDSNGAGEGPENQKKTEGKSNSTP